MQAKNSMHAITLAKQSYKHFAIYDNDRGTHKIHKWYIFLHRIFYKWTYMG